MDGCGREGEGRDLVLLATCRLCCSFFTQGSGSVPLRGTRRFFVRGEARQGEEREREVIAQGEPVVSLTFPSLFSILLPSPKTVPKQKAPLLTPEMKRTSLSSHPLPSSFSLFCFSSLLTLSPGPVLATPRLLPSFARLVPPSSLAIVPPCSSV